ncbi:MAG TPA: hypothetical protein VLG11_03305 [Candidatus Saccharimonadales bacterium]|nr:hypothetical protein [Candidatus Saccharimonadales bacterium]
MAAGVLFLGVGYMEQQNGYNAGVADTQQKIADAAKKAANDCLAHAEWKNAAILDIRPETCSS